MCFLRPSHLTPKPLKRPHYQTWSRKFPSSFVWVCGCGDFHTYDIRKHTRKHMFESVLFSANIISVCCVRDLLTHEEVNSNVHRFTSKTKSCALWSFNNIQYIVHTLQYYIRYNIGRPTSTIKHRQNIGKSTPTRLTKHRQKITVFAKRRNSQSVHSNVWQGVLKQITGHGRNSNRFAL